MSDIFSKIMANPDFMQVVSELKSNINNTSENTSEPEESNKVQSSENSENNETAFSLPPEIMSKLPQLLSSFSTINTISNSENKKSLDKPSSSNHKKLLYALKPYLSKSRQEAIDNILRITEITDVIGKISSNNSKEA